MFLVTVFPPAVISASSLPDPKVVTPCHAPSKCMADFFFLSFCANVSLSRFWRLLCCGISVVNFHFSFSITCSSFAYTTISYSYVFINNDVQTLLILYTRILHYILLTESKMQQLLIYILLLYIATILFTLKNNPTCAINKIAAKYFVDCKKYLSFPKICNNKSCFLSNVNIIKLRKFISLDKV